MQPFRSRDHGDDNAPQSLMRRLDRAAGAMNAFLLVFALGLAGLYFTSFLALHIPSMSVQMTAPPAIPAASAAAPHPAH